jgi:hypothetical protein
LRGTRVLRLAQRVGAHLLDLRPDSIHFAPLAKRPSAEI